jgi:hypothetical protein
MLSTIHSFLPCITDFLCVICIHRLSGSFAQAFAAAASAFNFKFTPCTFTGPDSRRPLRAGKLPASCPSLLFTLSPALVSLLYSLHRTAKYVISTHVLSDGTNERTPGLLYHFSQSRTLGNSDRIPSPYPAPKLRFATTTNHVCRFAKQGTVFVSS